VSPRDIFDRYFGQCPLVAIIRGVRPDEAEAIGQALFDGGIRIIEVPLNSPDPFGSIRAIAGALGDRALVGAGTVIDPADVGRVKEAGGQIIVAPDMNRAVIEATVARGMISSPGIFTPTEAFQALHCGAHVLKLFPAEAASPKVVKALRAVIPDRVPLLIVGGITPDSVSGWLEAGANGFGLGGGLYKPGQSPEDTLAKARAYAEAVKR
jgi:2-dehydro-3-deoxyphosphogalactonate aldolase